MAEAKLTAALARARISAEELARVGGDVRAALIEKAQTDLDKANRDLAELWELLDDPGRKGKERG